MVEHYLVIVTTQQETDTFFRIKILNILDFVREGRKTGIISWISSNRWFIIIYAL